MKALFRHVDMDVKFLLMENSLGRKSAFMCRPVKGWEIVDVMQGRCYF